MMKHSALKKISTLTLVALLSGGAFYFVYQGNHGTASAQMGGAMPAMPVPVLTITEQPVQIWKSFSGRLVAVDYAEIRPQVSGLIEKVHFNDGQSVKKGDILFTIDPKPYAAAVAQARAQLASAKDNLDYAQKDFARAQELIATGAISKQMFDQKSNALTTSKSTISAAEAALRSAAVDLNRATIKAPISGRISRAELTEGNLVTASAAPLLTSIVSEKEIYGDFDVDEQTYLDFVRNPAGDSADSDKQVPVKLKLNNDDKEYQGTIESFDNKINSSSGTIRARALFSNDDNVLLPGMYATIQIGSRETSNQIVIPQSAILTDQSRKYVYLAQGDAPTYREVKLGDAVGQDRVVLSGLVVGDQVVIDNLMKIRPGTKIKAMSPEELAAMKAQMSQPAQGAKVDEKSEKSAKTDTKTEGLKE